MRKFISLLLSLLLVLSLTIPAFASTSAPVSGTLQINGKKEIIVKPGSSYHGTDLFGSQFKDIMPGDRLYATVVIKADFLNFSEDSIRITMKGIAHGENNDLQYSEKEEFLDGKDQAGLDGKDPVGNDGIRDEVLTATANKPSTMTDFLSKLDLKITDVKKNKVIFDDKASAILEETTFDKFRNNGSVELLLELYWYPDANYDSIQGNEYDYNLYANRVGEIDWLITVAAYDDPTIDNPKTGDYIMMAVTVMALSAAALALLFFIKRRKNRK